MTRQEWDKMTGQEQWDYACLADSGNYLEGEAEIANLLGQAYSKFRELPVLHSADEGDFVRAIHAAQNIVLARAGLRATGIYRPEVEQPK